MIVPPPPHSNTLKKALKEKAPLQHPHPSLSSVCVLLLVSSIKWYKSLILEISING